MFKVIQKESSFFFPLLSFSSLAFTLCFKHVLRGQGQLSSRHFFCFFCNHQRGYALSMGGNWVTEFSAIQHSPLHTRRASVSGEPRKPIRISTCNKMHLRCSLYPFDGSLGFEFRFASRFCGWSWKVSLKRLMGCIGGVECAPAIFKRLNTRFLK